MDRYLVVGPISSFISLPYLFLFSIYILICLDGSDEKDVGMSAMTKTEIDI